MVLNLPWVAEIAQFGARHIDCVGVQRELRASLVRYKGLYPVKLVAGGVVAGLEKYCVLSCGADCWKVGPRVRVLVKVAYEFPGPGDVRHRDRVGTVVGARAGVEFVEGCDVDQVAVVPVVGGSVEVDEGVAVVSVMVCFAAAAGVRVIVVVGVDERHPG